MPSDGRHGERDRPLDAIPIHVLYGVLDGEASDHDVEFLHVERLRARSERFDWSIAAHAHHRLVQVMLVLDGGIHHLRVDDTVDALAAPAMVTLPSGVVHSFEFDPGSAGFVVTLADARLDTMPTGGWIRERLFHHARALPVAETSVRRLAVLCEELLLEHDGIEVARAPVMESLLAVVLTTLARTVDRADGAAGGSAQEHVRSFRAAVEEHLTEHWPVRRYADHLHLSESSLNRVCRQVVGETAFEVVQSRLELEARRRLLYTGVTVQRLANDLGFADPSYFSRFFRRRTGRSPGEYRATQTTA